MKKNFVPTIATSDCGYGDYTWLSTDGMGEIIDNRDDDSLSIHLQLFLCSCLILDSKMF